MHNGHRMTGGNSVMVGSGSGEVETSVESRSLNVGQVFPRVPWQSLSGS